MQDIHSVDGEIRRLRPHHHHHPTANQALNCPRCDSSNTKFCYYNNYNLSQPRHFCKGCRRYWTKGGLLRNVPVGGGSRRKTTKRSTPKSSPSLPKSTSNSSSESSSLTAATTTTTTATEEFVNPSQGSDLEILEEESTNCGFFSGIGSFTSLITSSNDQLSFRFDDLLDPQTQWEQVAAGSGAVEVKPQPAAESPLFLSSDDVKVEFSPATGIHRSCTSIFRPPSEWEPSSDEGLFDLPDGVDHWTQINPWSDVDQPTYIP